MIQYCDNLYASYDPKEEKYQILTSSVDEMVKKLNMKQMNNKPFYEWILNTETYVKPYFDIDCKNCLVNGEELLNNAAQFIKDKFNSLNLAISCSSYEQKISYHVIVCDVKIMYADLIEFKQRYTKEFKELYLDID